jgi:gentisate 1,2-dioxygenase
MTTRISDEALQQFYDELQAHHLNPLWTQLDTLMPTTPTPKAVPYTWKWSTLYPWRNVQAISYPSAEVGSDGRLPSPTPASAEHPT